ncbi:MAG: 3-deoxy-7-phosphoheptulonate synthase class II [Myxococcales bacterium]|nr:3-deoxy-7-phosphoheptulonate synthase class II [Myxococcales bacterium]MDD9966339.1 3-deoxy-7-phosphoheptulonate synthase class II [Myxococcales bacterium]
MWAKTSWREREALQQPDYEDAEAVRRTLAELSTRPPLVSVGEVERLRAALTEAALGQRFVLHGGDCAETFASCTEQALRSKLEVLLQMSLVLTYATRRPVVRIGRIAGQYAKPRSRATERVGEQELPSYRGDIINGAAATPEARRPDPTRMLEAYGHAAASLNFLRALIEGGFADLHHPQHWALELVSASPRRAAYERTMRAITDAIELMESIGASSQAALRRVELYTSHEALLLPWEEALTREREGHGHYNLSAHMLWLGYRTSQLDGSHVEYLRGLRNPVGIKVGGATEPAGLCALLARVDPSREPGRITLISRLGEAGVERGLPPLIRAVRDSGHRVLWSCDPMHGNTETTASGRKTRRMEAIFGELECTFAVHLGEGSRLGGVHFEMTGEDVTECLGGSLEVREADLHRSYETACDPRLNGSQALEMAFRIAELLRA